MKLLAFIISTICFLQANAQFDWPVEVQYDSAWKYKNLKLIPVRFTGDKGRSNTALQPSERFLSLPEAMRQKKVTVKELKTDGGSDRGTLVVRNYSKDSILINSGDVVSGGKQDRMIAETTIIPPSKEKKYVNVFCVEKGRWDNKRKPFKYFAPADYKLKKAMDTRHTQQEVWKTIDEKYKAESKKTETSAYKDVSKSKLDVDSGYIKFFMRKFIESDRNFCGFIAVTNNAIITTDLYGNSDFQNTQYATNLSNYVDAAVREGDVPIIADSKVEAFIRPILSDEKTRNKYLEKRGRVFKYENKIIHIVAYGD